jgi:predicted DNA-binding transcriptional regulator AlpA
VSLGGRPRDLVDSKVTHLSYPHYSSHVFEAGDSLHRNYKTRCAQRPFGDTPDCESVRMSSNPDIILDEEDVVPSSRPTRWLSIRQIAADLGVSTSTAYKWSARGQPFFPRCIRLRNGDIRVRVDWYESWLAALEE